MPNNFIITLFLVFISGNLFSQINTYSPYSRFGFGELTKQGYGQNLSMGTAGTAYRSNKSINYLNPASYSALDTLSFIFDFGFQGNATNYKTDSLSSSNKNLNFHHIAIAFPFTHWWKASIGVSPFSSVGYNIVDQSDNVPGIGQLDNYYEGMGGLNQFYIGTSLMAFEKFSFGVNLSFLFGYLQHSQSVNFPEEYYYARSIVENRLSISDAVLNFGVQYHEIINDRYFIILGATYNPKTALNTTQTLNIQNIFRGNRANLSDSLNTVIYPEFELTNIESEEEIIYPESYSFGLSFGIKDKLSLMGDYEARNWEETIIPGESDSLVNSSSMKFGMEYTPNSKALRGYYNKVHYRLGGYYSNTYLRIVGNQLQDYGITFGVGLPFKGTKTTFNLGMVLGQRGTTENNLIKENYGIINVSFTFHDFWFLKRKFD